MGKMLTSPIGRAGRGRRESERGYTLIELLVVLSVIGIIFTLAMPVASRSLPGFELRQSAEMLVGEFRRVRSIAMRDNLERFVEVDVRRNVFSENGEREIATVPGSVAISLITATREVVDEDRGRFRFYPDGTSTGGTLRLQQGTRIYELEIDWFDGSITKTEPAGD